MSRVRTKDTDIEARLASALRPLGFRFRKHDPALPGCPDIVFPESRVAVFVDGDFWHGFRYPSWTCRLSRFWRKKIEGNRARDARNFARLRRHGWRVIRVWQHQVERGLDASVARIVAAL